MFVWKCKGKCIKRKLNGGVCVVLGTFYKESVSDRYGEYPCDCGSWWAKQMLKSVKVSQSLFEVLNWSRERSNAAWYGQEWSFELYGSFDGEKDAETWNE